MRRVALRPVLDVVLTLVLALVALTVYQWLIGDQSADAAAEGFRLLFEFMDVGLVIWALLLVIFTVLRRARGGVPAWLTYLFLLAGTVVNAIVVLVVGFFQGGWAAFLVLFAMEAGIACLIAAAIVIPLVHRLLR